MKSVKLMRITFGLPQMFQRPVRTRRPVDAAYCFHSAKRAGSSMNSEFSFVPYVSGPMKIRSPQRSDSANDFVEITV